MKDGKLTPLSTAPKLNTCVLTKQLVDGKKKGAILEIQDALTGEVLFMDPSAYGKTSFDEFKRFVNDLKSVCQ